MTQRESLCEVCGRRPRAHVCCSPFGAMSLGYCDVCLQLGLEPPGIVAGVATVMCGGWEHSAEHVRGYPAHAVAVGLWALHTRPEWAGA